MYVYPYNTTVYENKRNWTLGQNKPNSNPISSKAKIACQKIRPHPQKRKAQEKSGFFLNSLIYWLGIY